MSHPIWPCHRHLAVSGSAVIAPVARPGQPQTPSGVIFRAESGHFLALIRQALSF